MRRDELVEAAMRLFGEQGYSATTVADIQVECGLTGGSGALYKHFGSKHEVLAEGIDRYVADLERSARSVVDSLPDDPRAAFTLIAGAVNSAMQQDRAMIRVGMRDLDEFPELRDRLWSGLMAALYREIADWLGDQQRAGRFAVVDTNSTAAVLVASVTYYRVLEALMGHPPGDVGADAYFAAWVDSAVATVTGTQP